ncbi:hypothetical protein FSOLCH5_013684 [Fusarium solani]
MPEHCAGQEEDASGIEVDDIMLRLVDIGIIGVAEKCRTVDAGAVDKEVDLAKGLGRRISEHPRSLRS